ncbi:hypothetical protein [Fodinicola feengrottensis]|uniref:hypothetical protein n=1 Tax=Fodinicola feengrottensis TaxID=435914 RepID=UPI002442996C|nr:hypothetical protein [Fodinicola feengrottensis]
MQVAHRQDRQQECGHASKHRERRADWRSYGGLTLLRSLAERVRVVEVAGDGHTENPGRSDPTLS